MKKNGQYILTVKLKRKEHENVRRKQCRCSRDLSVFTAVGGTDMKYCPKCQADVEGLLYRCDLCGASLEEKKKLFGCAIFELPQCLHFSDLIHEMLDAAEPCDGEKYASFLEHIGFTMVCYPESMLAAGNVKNRIYYSAKRKYARITIAVDFNSFVYAANDEKARILAEEMQRGIYALQKRLAKDKLFIDDIVSKCDDIFNRYILST